jgi:hypothetical protein
VDIIPVRPARIQDVAAAAGVSVSTVSNVLNRPERVNARTAARVRDAVAALDYVPHPGAAGLRTGHVLLGDFECRRLGRIFHSHQAGCASEVAIRIGTDADHAIADDFQADVGGTVGGGTHDHAVVRFFVACGCGTAPCGGGTITLVAACRQQHQQRNR